MHSKQIPQGWLVRLDKGEALIGSLVQFCKDKNIRAAWLQGLGAVLNVEIGFYDLPTKQYVWNTYDQELEITSAQGNVSINDGELMIHLHGNFSNSDYQVVGGHIKEAVVGGTAEFIIMPFGLDLKRVHSEEIGLKLLDI